MSPQKINEIKNVIKKYMDTLMYLTTGDGTKPSPEMLKKLGVPKELVGLIDSAYKYGKLSVVSNKKIENMSDAEVDKLISAIKLTANQHKALEYIKLDAGNRISNLSNNITSTVVTTTLQSSLSSLQGIRGILSESYENGDSTYQVVQKLRELTGDWNRDWHRVAHTEMWNAKLNGEIMAILDNESPYSDKGKDTLVFKRPAPNACVQCKRLYLERDGVTPRVFKLSDMLSYGSNYGKKVADWKPVVGVLHPNCMCPLSIMPNGYKFDSNGRLVPVD